MINLDLGKVFNPAVTDLLHGFVPGLFFEICILLANPHLAQRAIAAVGSEHYLQLFIVLFIALIVGISLIQWVRFIQIQFTNIIRCFGRLELARKLRDWRRARAVANKSVGTLDKLNKADLERHDVEQLITRFQRAWVFAASAVLKRYGVEVPPKGPWDPWPDALGFERPEEKRGGFFVMALHATGWSGLVARHYASNLHVRGFTAFCLFLIGYGLLHDWEVARTANEPLAQWGIALRRVVRELRQVPAGQEAIPEISLSQLGKDFGQGDEGNP